MIMIPNVIQPSNKRKGKPTKPSEEGRLGDTQCGVCGRWFKDRIAYFGGRFLCYDCQHQPEK